MVLRPREANNQFLYVTFKETTSSISTRNVFAVLCNNLKHFLKTMSLIETLMFIDFRSRAKALKKLSQMNLWACPVSCLRHFLIKVYMQRVMHREMNLMKYRC